MKTARRLLLAATLSPLAIVPVVHIVYLVLNLVAFVPVSVLALDTTEPFIRLLETTMAMSVFGVVFAWGGTFLIGIPAYGLLKLLGLAQTFPCALVGGVCGFLLGSSMFSPPDFCLMTFTSGAVVAAWFCRIASRPGAAPAVALSSGIG